jgi:predicted aldo/keto reductase-like oxidoreductase
MSKAITRRELLFQAAAMAAVGISGTNYRKTSPQPSTFEAGIPRRSLGKTGVRVSMLAFGCGGSFTKGYPNDDKALEVLNWMSNKGINYFDTAHDYGNGESERRLGLFLKDHRKKVFVSTKLLARSRENLSRQFELSLKRLQIDQVDLLNIHAVSTMEEVALIGIRGGIYEGLSKLKEQKGTKFIGFSCHSDGHVAKRALEQYDFDCCTLQLNAAKTGGFEDTALPPALKKNMGVVAMKATGQGKLLGKASGKGRIEELLRYVWNLPIASIVLGMPDWNMAKQDIELARSFKPMANIEAEALRARMAHLRPNLERFFSCHSDIGVKIEGSALDTGQGFG